MYKVIYRTNNTLCADFIQAASVDRIKDYFSSVIIYAIYKTSETAAGRENMIIKL